jgi:uncharacterized protein YjbI with pentapeptide repeats
VLLERLRRLLQKKRLDEVERTEPSVIKNVLIAALKIEQLSSPDGRTINTANNSDRTLSQASQDRPGAKQALCKYIADELVNTVPSGRFSEGERPANVDGKSPLGSDFQKCLLREVFWAGVDARGVDFYGSDLSGASLRGAALQRAKFYQAIMKGAVLEGADLTLANLGGAQLQGANLEGATLAFANLQGADLTDAKLDGVDLCKAVYNDQALQKLPETKWPPNFPGSRGAKLMNGRAYRPEQIAVADISGQ